MYFISQNLKNRPPNVFESITAVIPQQTFTDSKSTKGILEKGDKSITVNNKGTRTTSLTSLLLISKRFYNFS